MRTGATVTNAQLTISVTRRSYFRFIIYIYLVYYLHWENCLVRTTKLVAIHSTKICRWANPILVKIIKAFVELTKWVWLVQENVYCLNHNLVGLTKNFCWLDSNQTFCCSNQTVFSCCGTICWPFCSVWLEQQNGWLLSSQQNFFVWPTKFWLRQ